MLLYMGWRMRRFALTPWMTPSNTWSWKKPWGASKKKKAEKAQPFGSWATAESCGTLASYPCSYCRRHGHRHHVQECRKKFSTYNQCIPRVATWTTRRVSAADNAAPCPSERLKPTHLAQKTTCLQYSTAYILWLTSLMKPLPKQ